MSNPEQGSDPFGESQRGFLESTRSRVIAAGLAVVVALGVAAEAKTGFIGDQIQGFHDDHTQVTNIYYQPFPPPEGNPLTSTLKPVISVTEFKQLQKFDNEAAANAKWAFEKTMDNFYDGMDFFRELNDNGVKKSKNTRQKVSLATSIRNSLNGIMEVTDEFERDGVALFDSLIDDKTQEAIKDAGITVEGTTGNNGADLGTSKIVSVKNKTGTTTRVIVQFVPKYLKNPDDVMPDFYPRDYPTPEFDMDPTTELSRMRERIAGIKEIMLNALQARQEKVAEKRVSALLKVHPDLWKTHNKHTGKATKPEHHISYTASQELSALKQILENRKYRAIDRKLEREGKLNHPTTPNIIITPTPPHNPDSPREMPQHPQ